jgi:predicted  nucleic acid-binding Zn-ribbon protein
MTPEEIQKTIEQMLAIQRELQENQLKNSTDIADLSANIADLSANIAELVQHSREQDKRIEQLIGYSITGESDRLDLEERMRILERKVKKIEQSGQN